MSTNRISIDESAAARFLRVLRHKTSRFLTGQNDQKVRSAESLRLLKDPAFQAAYTQLFEAGINELMRLDPLDDRDRIVHIQIELKALESIARQLNSHIAVAEFEAARQQKKNTTPH